VILGVEAAIVDGELVPGDVALAGDRVAEVGLAGGGRGIAVPGLVDLQVNGFAGVDFAHADAADYRLACERLAEAGTTSFQPTLVTATERELRDSLSHVPGDAPGRCIMGIHLEGPFLSPVMLGAHVAAARRDPDERLLERLLASGPVSQMTLAPELPGALALIDLLQARGVVVSLGHSNATADEAARAFDRGARTVTHLFNAMRPFAHRDPGIAGAALARDDVVVQAILDGNHLADETARLVWHAAAGRLALVSDAMAAAGAGDGTYVVGPVEVTVHGGIARRADGALAGSTITMLDAMRNLHALGASLTDAVAAATSVPARIARRPDLGVLRPGAIADIVILDDRLEVQGVIVSGRMQPARVR
jgi:N-acetylglucosamine-6-phosphate deacetylase